MDIKTVNQKASLGLRVAMFRKLKNWMVLVAFMLATSAAWSATLKNVDFASLPGDRTKVILQFDATPPSPQGYTIEKPARIALDLKGVTSGLGQRSYNLGLGNAQSLTVVEAKDRTRLIFNLSELVPYTTEVNGNTMALFIGNSQGETQVQTAAESNEGMSAPSSQAAASAAPVIKNVDFRRGKKGDGQVVLTFSTPEINVDLTEQAGRIRLRLPDANLPESQRRRLDVTDFATPVNEIEAYVQDGAPIIDIQPTGEYDYLAYQADNKFTVSIERVTKEEADRRREEKFPYSGEKLSLNFQDIEVRSVLQLIADFTGLNLVASDTVKGRITLRLENVPWDQALELVLKTKGLDKRQVGNVLLVAPAEEIAAREKLELETNRQVKALAPVMLDIIQVNYAKAADLVSLLKQDKELISDRGFISSDDRTNTISVRETAQKLEEIRRLINTWDIPVRQVLIEARIVRAQTNVSKDLGVQWGGGYFKNNGSNLVRVGGSQETLGELTDVAAGTQNSVTFPNALMVDLGVSKANTSSIALGITADDYLIDLELSALESDGQAEIVAQPKVVTADRQTAMIQSGEDIPYQEASSSGATSVSFKEAVLSLEVTPQITPDDNIIMDLNVKQDSRGEVTAGVPSIDTNEVTTQVLVANGETVVLGGIFQSEVSTTVTKTPFLGDIPYLGRLFTKEENVDQRAELLIFITPKIVKSNLLK
ncbi:type IV pilus secretin PilQ [Marinobacteraceae bacterium S3BR75-40.1]